MRVHHRRNHSTSPFHLQVRIHPYRDLSSIHHIHHQQPTNQQHQPTLAPLPSPLQQLHHIPSTLSRSQPLPEILHHHQRRCYPTIKHRGHLARLTHTHPNHPNINTGHPTTTTIGTNTRNTSAPSTSTPPSSTPTRIINTPTTVRIPEFTAHTHLQRRRNPNHNITTQHRHPLYKPKRPCRQLQPVHSSSRIVLCKRVWRG